MPLESNNLIKLEGHSPNSSNVNGSTIKTVQIPMKQPKDSNDNDAAPPAKRLRLPMRIPIRNSVEPAAAAAYQASRAQAEQRAITRAITIAPLTIDGQKKIVALGGIKFVDQTSQEKSYKTVRLTERLAAAGINPQQIYLVNCFNDVSALKLFLGLFISKGTSSVPMDYNDPETKRCQDFDKRFYDKLYAAKTKNENSFIMNIEFQGIQYSIMQILLDDSSRVPEDMLHGLFAEVSTFLEGTPNDAVLAFTCQQGQNRSSSMLCSYLISKGLLERSYFNFTKTQLEAAANSNKVYSLLYERSKVVGGEHFEGVGRYLSTYGVPVNPKFRQALQNYTSLSFRWGVEPIQTGPAAASFPNSPVTVLRVGGTDTPQSTARADVLDDAQDRNSASRTP